MAGFALATATDIKRARSFDRTWLIASVVVSWIVSLPCGLMEMGAFDTNNGTAAVLLLLPPLIPFGLFLLLNGLLSRRGQSIGLASTGLAVVRDDGHLVRTPYTFLFGGPYGRAALRQELLTSEKRIYIVDRHAPGERPRSTSSVPVGSTPGGMMDQRADVRPMGIGDLLSATIHLYRTNVTLLVATAAMIEVPVQIITALLPLSPADPAHFILEMMGLAITSAALAVVSANRYLNRPATAGDAYRAILQRLGPLLVAGIWTGLRLLLLGIACVITIGIPFVVYFGVAWSLVPHVVMLDNADGIAASRRSRELVAGHWWAALGLVGVTWLFMLILISMPEAIVRAILGAGAGSASTSLFISGFLSLIIAVLMWPLQVVALTLFFYDLKIRKEASAVPPPPTSNKAAL